MKTPRLLVCLLLALCLALPAAAQNKCYDPNMSTLLGALGLPSRPPTAGVRSSPYVFPPFEDFTTRFTIANLSDSEQEVTVLGYNADTGVQGTNALCIVLPPHAQGHYYVIDLAPTFGSVAPIWMQFINIPRKTGGAACSPLANVTALLPTYGVYGFDHFPSSPDVTLSTLAGNQIEVFEEMQGIFQGVGPFGGTVLPTSCLDLRALQQRLTNVTVYHN